MQKLTEVKASDWSHRTQRVHVNQCGEEYFPMSIVYTAHYVVDDVWIPLLYNISYAD